MLCLFLIIIAAVSLQGVQSLFYNNSSNNVRHGSCRLRSVRQTEYHWNSSGRSMTESFVLDDVEYKLCRYHVTWDEALVFCSSHKAHLATLDSEEKTAFVVQAIASSSSVSEDYWIGAKKLYSEPWTWDSNKMRLSTDKDVISNIPIWYPEFESNDIHCLTIDRSGHDDPIFVPRDCNQRRGFICQRDNDRAFDNKIRMVAASRVGEQEFRLYAGRATWAEAVVQCRQEGLQIGEVKTVEEARAVAISMLRNRPEGIESAWIGGYTRKDDESTWRWVASGDKIENNDMWRANLSESSGGCLLLDRHVCESPVYVESTCDRKRDVLCQKPTKKRLSKTPVAVFIDGCPYWIGFHPLTWQDARRSCESLNASLVVLDSPATISHMMSLMLDNKAELRHIWTDGRRSNSNGHWEWAVTGNSIPDSGNSFIPWCPDDEYYTKESGCLNLDRENLDSPLVYGLSCREKQTYVCQPRAGDCVSYSMRKLTIDAVSYASEDIQKETNFESPSPLYNDMATLPMSTVTTPYPTSNHDYAVIPTTLHINDRHLGGFVTWKPGESVSGKNSSSVGPNLSQYLKPLAHFTLPSLPQFGIKVVSAAEATTTPISFEIKKKKNKAYKFLTTSSYASTATVLPPSSSFPTTVKKSTSGSRKMFKHPLKSGNVSISSPLPHFVETTFSSIFIGNTTEKSSKILNSTRSAFSHASSTLKQFLGSKNSSKSSKVSRISTTPSLMLSDDLSSHSWTSDVARTRKYSIKTTRDLNSPNATKIASTTTTKAPDIPGVTKDKKIDSVQKEFRHNSPPKPFLVDSFPVKSTRPNSTLAGKRQHFRITTEATTPYDAIDEDYYDDEKDDKSGKKSVDEDAKESNEYSEDYESTSSGKLRTKKKGKQTSTSSIRKNHAKRPKPEKEEEEEEEEEDEENEDRTKSSIPMVEELSKNLEDALVNMMKQGVERKNNEKTAASQRRIYDEKKSVKEENTPRIKQQANNASVEKGVKSLKLEIASLRPYYAFEGPMIVALSESSKIEGVGRTVDNESGNGRTFKMIGQQLSDERYPDDRKIEGRKLPNNETRRQMKTEQSNQRNPASNLAASMSGMPPIQPNDPNSMIQLGRYFKNQFGGLVKNSETVSEDRRPLMTNTREEIERSDQRRYGPPGRQYSQDRVRGYPAHREEELRRKGQRLEKPRRSGVRESESNYYGGARRIYPRGNYDVYGSLARQGGRRNERRPREEEERLDVPWPDKNRTNYEIFDELSKAVSPRSFSIPIRTTRSFHEETGARKIEIAQPRAFPDFKLSKLVKEVKIDLDQRMLRRYLEGFARKIARTNSGANDDDWKNNWRQFLRQMLSVFDRMNINVNGDLMKLRVGSDDGENRLSASLENSRELGWKSGLRKQRKDSANISTKNYSNQLNKTNETSQNNSGVVNRLAESMQGRQASPNSLQTKDQSTMNFKARMKGETTDNYRRIYDALDSVAKSPSEKEKIKETILPGQNTNYEKFGDKSSLNREEITNRPAVNLGENFRHTYHPFQSKNTNFSNSRIVGSPRPIIPVVPLSTVFGYRPLMPQLHHRMIFQPGWGQIRPESQKAVFNGEYLPKGTLSRIVGSEYKNQHFGGKSTDGYVGTTSSTASQSNAKLANDRKINEINNNIHSAVASVRGISFDDDSRLKQQKKSNEEDVDRHYKVPGTDNNTNGGWRYVAEEIGRNKLRSKDSPGYYNVTHDHESSDRRIDVDEEDTRGKVDGEVNPTEDNERQPVWSPAHRLTKALELSVLRKFGVNPSNSLRGKNLVTRNVKKIEAIHRGETPLAYSRNSGYNRGRRTEQNVDEEPSIVSLRMIMDPEKKFSRITRQSQRTRIAEVNPRTVELRVQFSGKEEPTKAITERIYSTNNLIKNEIKNQTFDGFSMNNQSLRRDPSVLSDSSKSIKDENVNSLLAIKRPIRFIDKERRRAMLNRLRERSRSYKRNNPRSYATRRQNGTAMSDPRDRRSRNIAMGRKNTLSDGKTSKEIPKVKHYISTSLRSSDEKNFTNRGINKWRNDGKPYGKGFGIDWAEQASALFTDLKESSDDLTLYIDLTFGRVGSKPRNGGRSRG